MTPRCRFALAAALAVAVASVCIRYAVAADLAPAADASPSAVPGVVVVKLRSGAVVPGSSIRSAAALDRALAAHAVVAIDPVLRAQGARRKANRVGLERAALVRYAGGTPPQTLAAALSKLADVEYAEPLWEQRIAVIPNDPSWSSQATALARMRFPEAWETVRGEQGGVVVAVVDGGTSWNHVDLVANIWSNPGEIAANGIDDDGNGFVDDIRGWNFATDSNDPTGLPNLPNNRAHGTHVAGIVCAVANNGLQVAGASWNARVMPVCVSSTTNDNSISFGYLGILYAAETGADIINCSWGSVGTPSEFEREVIEFAWSQGAVVVAAAGNGFPNPTTQPHFPSAYPHALAVANVNNGDLLVSSSNYGLTVDVAAQGQSILSTTPGDGTGFLTGTSMSSPFVAAACALVKTRWPDYTPDQVAERVRVTADNIDALNPARAGMLGSGRINVHSALSKNTPAVRLASVELDDADGDGVLEPGEIVDVHLSVTNHLAACTGLEFRLRETSPHVSVVDSVATLAALDSLQTSALTTLRFLVSPSAPIGHAVGCLVAISAAAPAYTDKDRFNADVLPPYAHHDINRVHTTVTSLGKLGFSTSGGSANNGIGFRYDGGTNLLFEAALMIGTGASRISDAARTATGSLDDDFVTTTDGVPHVQMPGPWAPQQIDAAFTDFAASAPLPVAVHQQTYAYVDDVHDDYIVARYTIRNTGGSALDGVRVGWFCDWDIDGGTFDTNRTGFDATRALGWARDTGDGPSTWVGIQVLNALGATSYRGIWNDAAMSIDWGVYDGFTDSEKWDCLAGGIVHPEVGPGDVSNAIATGPFDIAPGDSIEVGFAFLGGADLPSLQAHADAAALKWQHLHSGTAVAIADLAAVQDGGAVRLTWRTSGEENVAAFRVLRSTDGGTLERLRPDVEPHPSRAYAFTDAEPAPGTNIYRIGEVAPDGGVVLVAAVTVEVAGVAPARTWLGPAVPNPFNPATVVRFGLASPGDATLEIFDARGRRVRRLWHQTHAGAGDYAVRWDGRDDAGGRVASGAYLVRLRAAGASFARRVTLLQ